MRPTITELRSWDIPAFQKAASELDKAIDKIDEAIAATKPLVAGTNWEGTGKEAATLRAEQEIDTALEVRDAFSEGSIELTNAYDSLYWAREFALRTVADAEDAGLTVLDSGTVVPGAETPPELLEYHAGRISGALDDVDRADVTARDQLKAVTVLANSISQSGGHPHISIPGDEAAASPDSIIASWETMTPEEISTQIAGMSEEERALLVNANPEIVGRTDGVPWEMRFDANEINIFNALTAERRKPVPDKQRIRTLEDMLAPWDNPTTSVRPKKFGQTPNSSSNDQVKRNFLKFDPSGQGRAIEVVGTIDKNTQNIGVFIPGTGTELNSINGQRERAGLAMKNAPYTATIVWQDADFPDDVESDASFSNYADTAAPELVEFSQELQRNIGQSAPGATSTYVAHSYGASILGTANTTGGFYSDREVYAAPSGSGTGVETYEDWHNTNPDVQRYTLTAPGDNIGIPQQAGETLLKQFDFDHFVLSENPAKFEAVTRLDTGYYSDGRLIVGPGSHSGIFAADSDSMNNITAVINGGEVTLYNPRSISYQPEGEDSPEFMLTPSGEDSLIGPMENLVKGYLEGEKYGDPNNYHVVAEDPPRKVPVS